MRSRRDGRDHLRFTNIRTREWRRLTPQARLGCHLECYADTQGPIFPQSTRKCAKYAALIQTRKLRPCLQLIPMSPSYMRKPPIDRATFLFAELRSEERRVGKGW